MIEKQLQIARELLEKALQKEFYFNVTDILTANSSLILEMDENQRQVIYDKALNAGVPKERMPIRNYIK